MPRASVGTVELEYEIAGPEAGAPLLLIGGIGSQLVSWDDEVCQLLARRGYRVVRFDNRDSGLSTCLDEAGAPDLLGLLLGRASPPYTLDDLAVDALRLLEVLRIERAHVVGISMGGMVAQLLALQHPERVLSVAALLSGPPGRPSDLPQPQVIDVLLRPVGEGFEDRVAAAVELRRALANGGDGFDAELAGRRARAQVARAHNPGGALRQAAAVLGTPNRLPELAGLRVPALLIHGELDPLVPWAAAEAAAATIPGAQLVRLPGVGHDLPPAVAIELIERVCEFHAGVAPVS